MEKIYIGAMPDYLLELTKPLRKSWVLHVVAVPVGLRKYSMGLVASPMAYSKASNELVRVITDRTFKSPDALSRSLHDADKVMLTIARHFSELIAGRI